MCENERQPKRLESASSADRSRRIETSALFGVGYPQPSVAVKKRRGLQVRRRSVWNRAYQPSISSSRRSSSGSVRRSRRTWSLCGWRWWRHIRGACLRCGRWRLHLARRSSIHRSAAAVWSSFAAACRPATTGAATAHSAIVHRAAARADIRLSAATAPATAMVMPMASAGAAAIAPAT
jgi:hypothetical protein